jgi:serine/threonine-protein kinase
MTDDPRLRQLLDELHDSHSTPEEVCRSCPELLPQVRARWRAVCRVRADLDALFPAPTPTVVGAPTPQSAALPQVPGYQVEAVLGRGGVGVVYRAQHLRLHRPVALKMLLAGVHAQPEERERFLREAEAVAGLRHPNVVQLYDVGEVDARPYFTMELVEGGNLAQKLAGAPLPAREAATLVAAVAEAVHAAHTSGIVHRDLKPGNILLQRKSSSKSEIRNPKSESSSDFGFRISDFEPKVTDFGLARRLEGGDGLTLSGTPVGTPSYMAPEQARGHRRAIGPATDVYALGAILYECLTGRPPFRAETGVATLQQVISESPVPPSRLNTRVPRDLETVCLKCLHKEPHLRYPSAAALAEDLRHFLRGEAITVRPERWLGRLARRVRRRPVFSATVVAVTVALVGLAGGGLWLLSERWAAGRGAQAEQAATERAAAQDAREMVEKLGASSWPEARAALERGRARLGDRGSADLRRLLEQGTRELELAGRLDAIRMEQARSVRRAMFAHPGEYEEAFRGAGLGEVGDDPEAAAARVRASNIPDALVAALDHWSVSTWKQRDRNWVLAVARLADPDPTGWRDRARDPAVRADPAALVDVIKTAPVAEQSVPLLLALDWHLSHPTSDSQERLPFLKRVQQAHPGDFWANLTLGKALEQEQQRGEAIRYYQAAVAIRPKANLGHHHLGLTLLLDGRMEEAAEQFRQAVDIDPTDTFSHHLLAGPLLRLGRQDEAIDRLQVAVGLNPNDITLRTHLGTLLENAGRSAEALACHQKAVALDPTNWLAQNRLRSLLVRLGRGEEARTAWQRSLERDPPEHDAWYGYAEFCLFLGQEDEYRRARRDLLAKFGVTTNPHVMQRTAVACLLRPATGDELRQAADLAERAAGVAPSEYQGDHRNALFAQGLAEYRRGRFDRAISLMGGEASRVLGPAPRLVLAMALHRSEQVAEARKTLAAAVLAHDWRTSQVNNQDDWIFHVLRREAEGLILPDLQALLDGNRQPQDNDERLALLGACQFTNRSVALARLYADAFDADPNLAENVPAGTRYHAARAAVMAGCGQGKEAEQRPDKERALRRRQALDWLRQDLGWWGKRLANGNAQTSAEVQQRLRLWRGDPDLATVRARDALAELPGEERERWERLWSDVDALLRRAGAPE